MACICPDNSLYPSRHAFYKVLADLWSNFIPLLYHSLPQFMDSFGWCIVLLKVTFEMMPEVFNRIQVKRLSRPLQYLNIIVFKPFFLLFWRCIWGHCPVGKFSASPASPNFQNFPPFHLQKLHNIALNSYFLQLLQVFQLHSSPYNPIP